MEGLERVNLGLDAAGDDLVRSAERVDDTDEVSIQEMRQHSQVSELPTALKNASTLPVASLDPEVFERVTAEILAKRDDSSVHFYGRRGQKQHGLDIFEEQASGDRVLYQVKRYVTITPDEIREAVIDYAGQPRSTGSNAPPRKFQPNRFIVVTSARLDDDTAKTEAISDLQTKYRGDLGIDVWGAEAVSYRLRDMPEVVTAIFGAAWAEEYCGSAAVEAALKDAERRAAANDALDAAIAAQYIGDHKIKFRQIDLVGITVDALFVDVPVRAEVGTDIEDELAEINPSGVSAANGRPVAGAAQVLLHPEWRRSAVIVGGPGQGKSTLLQYLCQYHRSRLMNKEAYSPIAIGLSPVTSVVRTPLKVELTKFAQWRREELQRVKAQQKPGRARQKQRGDSARPTLEKYLVHLIADASGQRFGRKDLAYVLDTRPILLALDGLDEVADSREREDVADEIRATNERLRMLKHDALTFVATRPGAVGNPIWRDDGFAAMFLQTLTPALRMTYLDRWSGSSNLDRDELEELRESFNASLTLPHVVELAGNPMQLAILLHLLHQVPSLPEKRTVLYARYIDVFMQRESKDPAIGANKELVVAFHKLLAWYLHSTVELGLSAGSISHDELKTVLTTYLTPRGIDPAVIDEIFGSVTQRVVCLTERRPGSREYEFEVQPLREYFASAYVYDTSPNDSEVNNRLAVLRALIPRQYWSNVTRFYAGELASGEVANIGYAIKGVQEDPRIGEHPISRIIAKQLLDDQAFAGQLELVTRDIVEKILSGPGAAFALDGLLQQDDQLLRFPKGTALKQAVVVLTSCALDPDPKTALPAAKLLRSFGAVEDAVSKLWDAGELSAMDRLTRLSSIGALEKVEGSRATALADLAEMLDPKEAVLGILIEGGAEATVEPLVAHCINELKNGSADPASATGGDCAYARLAAISGPAGLHRRNRSAVVEDASAAPRSETGTSRRRRVRSRATAWKSHVEALSAACAQTGDWSSAEPWVSALDAIQEVWAGDAWPLREAVLAVPDKVLKQLPASSPRIDEGANWREIAEWRLQVLHHKADSQWWIDGSACNDDSARMTLLVNALVTAQSAVIKDLVGELDGLLECIGFRKRAVAIGAVARYRAGRWDCRELHMADDLRLRRMIPSSLVAAAMWHVASENTREWLAGFIRDGLTGLWGNGSAILVPVKGALSLSSRKVDWKQFHGARGDLPAGSLVSVKLTAISYKDAQAVLRQPLDWPADIVRAAVDRLGERLGTLEPIASVATADAWAGSDGELLSLATKRRPARTTR
jgi:hypothetical protein